MACGTGRVLIPLRGSTANHIELMLSAAGFEDIELRADWTDAEPTRDTTNVVFLARKPVR